MKRYVTSIAQQDMSTCADNWTKSFELLQPFNSSSDLSNQPHSAHLMVYVTITDVNDFVTTYNGRNFSVGVYESPIICTGERIIKLSAIDLDEGPPLKYKMNLVKASHGSVAQNILNLQSSFVIDPFSSLINVGSLTLNRGSVDYYLFLVRAADRINIAETYLTINIMDVNDHVPEVTLPEARIFLFEGIPPGILVTDAISVTDADVGINSG